MSVLFSHGRRFLPCDCEECGSITHLPSLMYGAVFGGWWGCITSVLLSSVSEVLLLRSFSLKAISIHVLVGSVLAWHIFCCCEPGLYVAGMAGTCNPLQIWTSLLNIRSLWNGAAPLRFRLWITEFSNFQDSSAARCDEITELEGSSPLRICERWQIADGAHFPLQYAQRDTTLVELGGRPRGRGGVEALTHLKRSAETI